MVLENSLELMAELVDNFEESGSVEPVARRFGRLFSVVLNAPVAIRAFAKPDAASGSRLGLVPLFVVGFVVLALPGSGVDSPTAIAGISSELSRWLLLLAVASVGLKTVPLDYMRIGFPAAAALAVLSWWGSDFSGNFQLSDLSERRIRCTSIS